MIAVLSSNPSERAVFRSLFEVRGWPCVDCSTVRDLLRLVTRVTPRVIVVREKVTDGFSDEVIPRVAAASAGATRVLVLSKSALTPAMEGRQLALGADCVLRDPIRTEVLVAYITKYLATPVVFAAPPPDAHCKRFCGAKLDPADWSVTHHQRAIRLSPREMSLAELLSESDGRVVSYDRLYSTIINRSFAGDSSNMRVLLALLQTSMKSLGIRLRDYVSVIPKSGYRYTHVPHSAKPHPRRRRTATA